MKKINLMLIMITGVLLISCGGKNSNSESKEKTEELSTSVINADCQCADLNLVTKNADGTNNYNLKDIRKNGSNELYTGTCIEKDQHDSIVKKIEIKNGWVNKEIIREKYGNNYITTSDYTYENLEKSNGWEITLSGLTEEDNSVSLTYMTKFKEIKNKITYSEWSLELDNKEIVDKPNGEMGYGYGVYNIVFCPKTINGVFKENWKPNCMSNADYSAIDPRYSSWEMKKLSFEQFSKIMDGLKKEVPHFNYWK
ncbi:hypothetical protein [Flavobacterium marginilacus]|uniref:hypothetical protein n=1 Tax=Flavobacterium marginilacus TaxID=3003256 RepID=UPI00248D5C4A|nr:hypothetical protein [Flavobacterium marginilacus]